MARSKHLIKAITNALDAAADDDLDRTLLMLGRAFALAAQEKRNAEDARPTARDPANSPPNVGLGLLLF